MALSSCAQEANFVIMFLEEMTKAQKPSVIYEDNKGDILLAKNRKVVLHTKHIDIPHNFLRDMVEDKDLYIQYIRSEDNPEDIMTKNTLEAYFVKHTKRITEG